MWNSEQWHQFLSMECQNYPEETIIEDAKFLAEQRIEPSQFNDLIKMSESPSPIFNQRFQSLSIGNLIRFINGLKSYVRQNASNDQTTSRMHEDVSIPLKNVCQSYGINLENPQYSSWYREVTKFMFYFIPDNDQGNRRCVTAFAPTFAVTYAHGKNSYLFAAVYKNENIMMAGSMFKVYSFDTDGNGKNRKEINVQVVIKNDVFNYILLEALDGATFFDVEKESILKRPSIDEKFLCLGLSPSHAPRAIEGIVMTMEMQLTKYQKRGFMLADCIVQDGDSGGGLFSTDHQLLGIVGGALGQNRTLFVPADIIETGWEEWKHPSSFYYSVPELEE